METKTVEGKDITKAIKELISITYKNAPKSKQLASEGGTEVRESYIVSRIEVDNGRFIHYSGMEYPEKGFAVVEDIWAINIAKRLLMEQLRLIKYFIPSISVFIFLPWKLKIKILNRFITAYNEVAYKAMSDRILLEEFMTPIGREVRKMSLKFLTEIGIDPIQAEKTSDILGTIVNSDNAYRYRLHDLFNESSKKKLLAKPITELRRLMYINRVREIQHKVKVSNKVKLVTSVASFVLLHPKVRKAFKASLKECEYKNLLPDEHDRFWMCVRGDYEFMGIPHPKRKQMINHLKVCKPTKTKVT
jgi:hypothetical protein